MSSTDTGHKAERAAATYLEMRGYKIIERNWRRPAAEIDIVAEKDGVVHFVEVRYRATNAQGGGLESITPSKLRRMQRGAELWVFELKWPGEYVLSAIELAGPTFAIMNFVENIF